MELMLSPRKRATMPNATAPRRPTADQKRSDASRDFIQSCVSRIFSTAASRVNKGSRVMTFRYNLGMRRQLYSLAGFLAVSIPAAQAPRETAEVLVVGPMITLDSSRPRANALAVARGRILAVGERSSLEPFVGPRTKTIELPGVGVPGLADAHAHASGLGEQLATLDLRGLRKPEILARVQEEAARIPEGEW